MRATRRAWPDGAIGSIIGSMQIPVSWLIALPSAASALVPLAGGAIIGLAAALLWLLNGRIAGVSGIAGGLLRSGRSDRLWRALFVAGLALGGVLMHALMPDAFETASAAPGTVVLAGLLVGAGTTLANGCTSGHGVCGVSRLSRRSLVAVAAFVASGMITVYLVRHAFGGLP